MQVRRDGDEVVLTFAGSSTVRTSARTPLHVERVSTVEDHDVLVPAQLVHRSESPRCGAR
jgi:hypothetical protein